MYTIMGFHKQVNRWINIVEVFNPTIPTNLEPYLRERYLGDHPYSHFVVSEICAEDLLCYEVVF